MSNPQSVPDVDKDVQHKAPTDSRSDSLPEQYSATIESGLTPRQRLVIGMQQRQGNQAVRRMLAQIRRVPATHWNRQNGTSTSGDNAAITTVDANPTNAAAGNSRRIPISGLTHGNANNEAGAGTGRTHRVNGQDEPIQVNGHNERVSDRTDENAGDRQAIVVIPDNLHLDRDVQILLHFHGQNVGYRRSGGQVRDVAVDQIEQQIRLSGQNMIGILPQGSYTSTSANFGNIDHTTYIQEVWDYLTANNLWSSPAPGSPPPAAQTAPPRGPVVLSGHSGGGIQLGAMLDADRTAAHNDPAQIDPASATNRTGVGGLFLFESINRGQAPQFIQWATLQLNHDYLRLTQIANTTADPAARTAAQNAYLSQSMRLRAYYLRNGFYVANYTLLKQAIDNWFTAKQSASAAIMDPAVLTSLHTNYQVIELAPGDHDRVMGTGHQLQQALGDLPPIGAPAAAVPAPAAPPTGSPAPDNANGGASDALDGGTSNTMDGGVPDPDGPRDASLPGGVQRQDNPDSLDGGVADADVPIAGAPYTQGDAAAADAASGVDAGAGQAAATPAPAAYTAQDLTDAVVNEASVTHSTLIRPEDVRQRLDTRQTNADLTAAFDQALAAAPAGDAAQLQARAQDVLRVIERQWVLDPTTSSLDLLEPAQRDRYRRFAWQRLDYPGHADGEAPGPNEDRAIQMQQALARLSGERRPNSGATAVVTQSQFNSSAALRAYIIAQLRSVPNLVVPAGQPTPPAQTGHRINQTALEQFIRMRDAALADGVQLVILDGWRDSAVSQARSAGQNPNAIAHYSSHNLGLAIDLRMSAGNQHYLEATTRPMQNVIDMRQSPAHKWMFLHGTQYGWYPWHNEPWHWEFNPPGFREQFQADFQASQGAHP